MFKLFGAVYIPSRPTSLIHIHYAFFVLSSWHSTNTNVRRHYSVSRHEVFSLYLSRMFSVVKAIERCMHSYLGSALKQPPSLDMEVAVMAQGTSGYVITWRSSPMGTPTARTYDMRQDRDQWHIKAWLIGTMRCAIAFVLASSSRRFIAHWNMIAVSCAIKSEIAQVRYVTVAFPLLLNVWEEPRID